ncbi:hypothetical protein J31TS4_08560 [Paenibacillus sp. J31TS4]|uniref:ABC transporter substrate-binding protein n=1 Tax=Paenibacillus sp. J31TS4 TaxID=2807195 RepID=UPI001B10BBBC|nr:extracellular solute-binding protein [Paenibacillus sp. J31TS4]GIP37576.1 hypothetical protein J31TS4_08560 [Paenibacillus sp. J31TS4]
MKPFVKPLACLTMAGLLASFAAGCTGTDSDPPAPAGAEGSANVYPENGLPKDQKVTLTFAFWENGYGREWIDFAIEQFTKKYPNVKFDVTYSPKINSIISTRIAANNDADMFDIVSPSFSGGDTERVTLINSGKFESLEDLWDREVPDTPGKKLKDLVLDGLYTTHKRFDGQTYNLPMGGYTSGLFFDKTFFEKNGWNQNPQTWDEFQKLMEDIKSKGIVPITFPGIYPTYINYAFSTKPFELAEINGTLDKFMADYRSYTMPQYLAPESVESWNRLYELGKKGYFPEGVAALTHTQSQMQMLQHKAAMVSTGDWVQNEMKDSIPDGFKWGFMVIPFGTKPEQTKWILNGTSSGSMMIWKNRPELNKKWAKEFNLWLFTNDVQTFIAEHAGIFPIRKDFADDPARLAKVQEAPKAVMDYAKANKTRYESTIRDVTLTHPSLAQATKTLNEAITAIATGKKDPKPILEQVEKLTKEAVDAQAKK